MDRQGSTMGQNAPKAKLAQAVAENSRLKETNLMLNVMLRVPDVRLMDKCHHIRDNSLVRHKKMDCQGSTMGQNALKAKLAQAVAENSRLKETNLMLHAMLRAPGVGLMDKIFLLKCTILLSLLLALVSLMLVEVLLSAQVIAALLFFVLLSSLFQIREIMGKLAMHSIAFRGANA